MRRAARWWKRALPAEPVVTYAAGPVGDDLTQALVPLASDLVTAVHAMRREVVGDILAHAAALAGDPLASAQLLAVLAAGMCSEDHGAKAWLGWTLDPDAYREYRSSTDALTASLRAGRTNDAALHAQAR